MARWDVTDLRHVSSETRKLLRAWDELNFRRTDPPHDLGDRPLTCKIDLANETADLETVSLAVANFDHLWYLNVEREMPQTIDRLPPTGYGVIAFSSDKEVLESVSFQLDSACRVRVVGSGGNYRLESELTG